MSFIKTAISLRCSAPLLSGTLLLLVFGLSVPVWAQSEASVSRSDTHHPQIRGSVDERVSRLTNVLQLDEAQRSAVEKILEQRRQEFWRIRRAPSLSGNERIDRVRALQQITVEQIRSVLNDEQKTKYDPLAVRRLEPAPEQRSVEDWLNATTKP